MKKWFRFFFLGFFSNKLSKQGAKRSYTNVFLAFILVLIFLWSGFVSAEILPFGIHYENSYGFQATAHTVFANYELNKRIDLEIEDGTLRAKKHGGEYAEALLVNTFENEADKQIYSVNGYDIVVDMRPSDSLAEIEAYCVSNDGKNTVISYEEYLTLSDVARLNFDFKLRYTGNELDLNDELVEGYRAYVDGLSDEVKAEADKFAQDFAENQITKSEYNTGIYELYFTNYYPEITEYEATSKVPLLRNYYNHQYISQGVTNFLFVFDDYMAGSFETHSGIEVSFYGFYTDLENGYIVTEDEVGLEAKESVDDFIKESFGSIKILILYSYAVNMVTFVPFIALMLLVVSLLSYSILKLRGIDSISSFGAAFKIVGAYAWFSGLISAVCTVIMAFFVQRNVLGVLPLVLFFSILMVRAVIFVIKESQLFMKQLKQQEAEQTEV